MQELTNYVCHVLNMLIKEFRLFNVGAFDLLATVNFLFTFMVDQGLHSDIKNQYL